jgi:hypothetical protein
MSSLDPKEDYLDEDKPFRHMIKKQNFCIISMLTPNAFPESKREEYKDQKILGIKVRGVFETYDEAKKQAEQLQKLDKFHNIFVGEVGKWLPFDVDISKTETEDDPVYREKSLNTYMKAYKDSLKEEEVEEKQRKDESLKGVKVVTGQTDAPASTGIGRTEPSFPGQVPGENQTEESVERSADEHTRKVDEYANATVTETEAEESVDDQINATKQDKTKIEEDLIQSKNNLKELESKLASINEMYAELKK